MKNKKILAALLCSALSLGYTLNTASAEEASSTPPQQSDNSDGALQEYDLDEYVVTANRMNVKKKDVAADTVVIDEQTIERGNYSRVSDALKDSGINVVQKAGASFPIINGDSRVIVLVDGRKVQWNHLVVSGAKAGVVDLDSIPMDNVARIEIVRGPNSSLYGNSAVGGVVNIITKTPENGQKTTVSAEYGTWDHRKGTISTQGGDDSLRYMLTYSKEKRGNYDYKSIYGGSREFPNSGIDRTTETLRLDKKLGDDTLTFEFANQERSDGYSLYIKDLANNTPAYSTDAKQDVTERSFDLTYNWGGELGKTNDYLRIYHNQEKYSGGFNSVYEHNLKTWGADLQKGWDFKNNTLLGGLSYVHDSIWELNGNTYADAIAMDKSASTTAAFLEDHWNLNDGWTLNLGSRIEHHDDFGTDVTSHVGVNKALSPITNAYVSWGQGVNNPTLKMRYADTAFWLGNPDLKQEKSQTFTVGFNSQLTPNTLLEGSVYTSKVNDAIEWESYSAPDGIRGMYKNIAEEKRRGMELTLSHVLSDQWKVRAGYSYSKIETKDKGSSFANWEENNRPNGYLLGLSYTQDKWDGDLTLERVTGCSENYFTGSDYTTLDLGINYRPDEDTKLYLKGYNLTDEAYEVFPTPRTKKDAAYPMPGRYFVFGVERSF